MTEALGDGGRTRRAAREVYGLTVYRSNDSGLRTLVGDGQERYWVNTGALVDLVTAERAGSDEEAAAYAKWCVEGGVTDEAGEPGGKVKLEYVVYQQHLDSDGRTTDGEADDYAERLAVALRAAYPTHEVTVEVRRRVQGTGSGLQGEPDGVDESVVDALADRLWVRFPAGERPGA